MRRTFGLIPLDTVSQKQRHISVDKSTASGVVVPHNSYESFLFQDICLSLLCTYDFLIRSLLSGNFHLNDNFSVKARGPTESSCRYPLTAAQAVEEYKFLKVGAIVVCSVLYVYLLTIIFDLIFRVYWYLLFLKY